MSLHEQRAMTVDEAIRRRRSVRGFLSDEVPESTLNVAGDTISIEQVSHRSQAY